MKLLTLWLSTLAYNSLGYFVQIDLHFSDLLYGSVHSSASLIGAYKQLFHRQNYAVDDTNGKIMICGRLRNNCGSENNR